MRILPLNNYQTQSQNYKKRNVNFGAVKIGLDDLEKLMNAGLDRALISIGDNVACTPKEWRTIEALRGGAMESAPGKTKLTGEALEKFANQEADAAEEAFKKVLIGDSREVTPSEVEKIIQTYGGQEEDITAPILEEMFISKNPDILKIIKANEIAEEIE